MILTAYLFLIACDVIIFGAGLCGMFAVILYTVALHDRVKEQESKPYDLFRGGVQ